MKSQLLNWPKRGGPCAAVVLVLLAGKLSSSRGQEAVRMSIASAEAAEARRRAATSIGYYNLKLGPTAWNFGTGLGIEYNSNVQNTGSNPEGDFIFRPQMNTRMRWPVSDMNSINLTLGGGYSAYVKHSELDRAFIKPGSELSFDLYVGEFWINLHDRFSITENSYQDPTVAGSGNYAQFQNALGVATTWDMNKTIVKVGYDHVNYDTLNGGGGQGSSGQPSGYSEVFSSSAGYALKPGMLAGVELGGSLINYTTATTTTPYNNAKQWNVGGFYATPVSEYIHFVAHAGYTVYSPDSGGTTTTSGDFSGLYAQADVAHQVNQYVAYSLSGGRNISVAFSGGTVERYFARWQANWQIVRKMTLGTSFSYENGTQLTGFAGSTETYNQYGPGISLSRPITAKLSSSLGYQLYWRDSNLAGRNYTVNVVSLNLNYTF
ncbi:MAG: outer membrane beta-barrel protein [Verrucomicrobiota bacterium]